MHQEHTFHPDLVNDVQMEGISCIVSQFYSSTLESRTALIKTIKEVEEHSFVIISLKTSAFWCKRSVSPAYEYEILPENMNELKKHKLYEEKKNFN
ncbi:hypothetical protein TKK_0013921 [Trichogramma kaykai]